MIRLSKLRLLAVIRAWNVIHYFYPYRVSFTGHEVRHADGRQLQRTGLTPDVEAAPTIQGIRDGRDEVLDRGVRFLEEELSR